MEQVFNLSSGGTRPVTTAKAKKPKRAKPLDDAKLPPNLAKATRLPVVDFNDPNRPLTCLEVDFPIAPINALSKLEGNAGKPIYQMSKWWARRRSCIFRAMLIAAGIKAPDDPEQAARLVWEYFYANHQKAGNFRGLKVLDPFMGGGTTLVEGARLGYHVTGNDLNPVAWFVVKNELAGSDPQQARAFFDEIEHEVKPLIHPFYITNCPGGYQGKWTDKRTGHVADVDPIDLPPEQRKYYEWNGAEIIYTFWAKHGPCMAEGCGHRTPIFKNPVIAEKKLVTDYIELRCPKTGAAYHGELGETRLAPTCERVVLDNEPRFVESTKEFALLFNDYNKGNSTEKRARVQCLLDLVETEPALRHPDTGEWCGAAIKATLERHLHASRTADIKKKDFNILSKPVFMYLLIDPMWFEATPSEVDGLKLGGYADADPNANAHWYRERLKRLRLAEVRGRVKLAEVVGETAPEELELETEGEANAEVDRKNYGLPPTIRLADGTVIDTKKGTFPESGSFQCRKEGRKQRVTEALAHARHSAPVAIYALQCFCPKRKAEGFNYGGRFFKAPDEHDIQRLVAADREWNAAKERELKGWWPETVIAPSHMTHERQPLPDHGYTHWWKMFNPRQLLIHATLLKTVTTNDTFPIDIKLQALGAFQQYLRMMCMFSFWHYTYDKLAPALSNANFHPKHLVVETNVFGPLGYGNWLGCNAAILEGVEWCKTPWEAAMLPNSETAKSEKLLTGDNVLTDGEVTSGTSTDLRHLPSESVELVITDPPFGNNLFYADMSEFFYAWVRLGILRLSDNNEDARRYFSPSTTPHAVEAVTNSFEHRDDRQVWERTPHVTKKLCDDIRSRSGDADVTPGERNPLFRPDPASDFYCRTLTACWSEASRILKPGGILAFTFHHSDDDPWVDVLQSLFDAGFVLVGTYPIRADETKGEGGAFGAKRIEYDIIHVCRKRLEQPQSVSWAKMRRWVREEGARLKTLLEHSHGQALSQADMRVILRGKALEFYSRHYGNVWIGQEILQVRDALVGINQLLDDLLATSTATGPRPPEAADPITRLFLRLFASRESMPRDELHKNLRGTTVDTDLLESRGWVRVVGTTIHAIPVTERFQYFTARGRNRKIIRSDLDQAHFLAGAALPRSGLNIEAELDRETFNPKPSVDALLDWIAVTDTNRETREAAVLAKNILIAWRTRKQTAAAQQPPSAQLDLQLVQSEA